MPGVDCRTQYNLVISPTGSTRSYRSRQLAELSNRRDVKALPLRSGLPFEGLMRMVKRSGEQRRTRK